MLPVRRGGYGGEGEWWMPGVRLRGFTGVGDVLGKGLGRNRGVVEVGSNFLG